MLGMLFETMASSPGVEGSSSSSSTVNGIEVDVNSTGSFSTKLRPLRVLERVLDMDVAGEGSSFHHHHLYFWLDIPRV